ncbi:hypothetical protein GCM10011390_00850 [Aureimonas endophytica]|uniref:Uncharacterized protein n=1 Tax=Aureimonas endophytica TaxID=2027858 RepID=A0A917E0U6_9HYPH|nr:hypothetical protein [Aureimonas endophytica]GGD86088.1 hypothetical protein GCM10011390_00850 [Aureimonas endophytica]
MFVVRIQNDEATLYRAFRRWQGAKLWAEEKNLEHSANLVDVFEASGAGDDRAAVRAVREDRARLVVRGEALVPPVLAMRELHSDVSLGTAFDYA